MTIIRQVWHTWKRFGRLIGDFIGRLVLGTFPRSWGVFCESIPSTELRTRIAWFLVLSPVEVNEKLWIKSQILDKLKIPAEKLLFVEHHLSHAASAFFCSPYDELVCFVEIGMAADKYPDVGVSINKAGGTIVAGDSEFVMRMR